MAALSVFFLVGIDLGGVKNSQVPLSWESGVSRRQSCPSLGSMTRPVPILGSGESNHKTGILGPT